MEWTKDEMHLGAVYAGGRTEGRGGVLHNQLVSFAGLLGAEVKVVA